MGVPYSQADGTFWEVKVRLSSRGAGEPWRQHFCDLYSRGLIEEALEVIVNNGGRELLTGPVMYVYMK
jgi:hypothetical protein